MIKFTLISVAELEKAFKGMGTKSQHHFANLYARLKRNGTVSVGQYDITGHEFLLWLKKKGIVK